MFVRVCETGGTAKIGEVLPVRSSLWHRRVQPRHRQTAFPISPLQEAAQRETVL